MTLAEMAKELEDLLKLRTPPVALSFRASPPANVLRVKAAGPSSCTYWKLAAQGQTFYTEAADHYLCPIGAYTHGVDLPPAVAKELEGVMGQWDAGVDASPGPAGAGDDAARKKLMARMNEILNRRSYIRNLVAGVQKELAEA